VTVLSGDNITVGANPVMKPFLTDTLLIADGDIKMAGTPGSSFTGLIAAHEQIEISGNTSITGYVIAEGAASTHSLVTANTLSGDAVVSYDCGLNPPALGPLLIIAWGF
jgi:hypothetical protein